MNNKIEPLEIQIRFNDCDSLGHVNNAVYLSYFEIARMHYFKHLLDADWDWQMNGIILVRNEVIYHYPLKVNQSPYIQIKLGKIGAKSFELHYEIIEGNKLYTSGMSKIVCYNFNSNKSVLIYEKMKLALSKLELI